MLNLAELCIRRVASHNEIHERAGGDVYTAFLPVITFMAK